MCGHWERAGKRKERKNGMSWRGKGEREEKLRIDSKGKGIKDRKGSREKKEDGKK